MMVDSGPVLVLNDERVAVYHGDSARIVLAPNSLDSIVTDPPAGIGFMGKEWDGDKGGAESWIAWLAELMRPWFDALKPGGHALVWAIPRTSDWTMTALRRCGFEIRDQVHDVFDADVIAQNFVDGLNDEQRAAFLRLLDSQASPILYHLFGTGFPKSLDVAKQEGCEAWSGWGTALKPAAEHWILARKPLASTVARNVLQFGTGALNIDACRIGTEGETFKAPQSNPLNRHSELSGASALQFGHTGDIEKMQAAQRASIERTATLGRWPAHLTLDEHTAALLDAQSGVLKSPKTYTRATDVHAPDVEFNPKKAGSLQVGHGDTGGASRFFYVAKGARSEKDAGLEHLAPRTAGEATDREDGSAGLSNPRAGAGRTGGARNFHPTVKSIALMRWLVSLVTPPNGVVADPFAGSGSTAVAALGQGFRALVCEREEDYLPIIIGRVRAALRSQGEAVWIDPTVPDGQARDG